MEELKMFIGNSAIGCLARQCEARLLQTRSAFMSGAELEMVTELVCLSVCFLTLLSTRWLRLFHSVPSAATQR